MSAHTPGPWGVIDGAVYALETRPVHGGKTCEQCGHEPLDCGPAVIVPVEPGALLDDIKNGHWDDCDAPLAADLQLMAAAPELLAACKRQAKNIAQWIDGGAPAPPDESKAIYDQMVAAITKAEGGAA